MAGEKSVETRLASLEARVEFLEKGRPGRKALPILVKEEHVCGIDPDSDSASCPYASIHYRQQGCLGDGCKREASEYYADYRGRRGEE